MHGGRTIEVMHIKTTENSKERCGLAPNDARSWMLLLSIVWETAPQNAQKFRREMCTRASDAVKMHSSLHIGNKTAATDVWVKVHSAKHLAKKEMMYILFLDRAANL